ncbi:MAG: GNAT family N-acetyltransferase [Clostridia bacterium]|nr:GNAT family N-acetyltransferase [Clostridia bacterium]
MQIKDIGFDELSAASRVLWKSFYHAEKNTCSMEGMERFRDLTEPPSLFMNCFDGSIRLFGAYHRELVAVGALKGEGHILLLYVLPEYAGKGIGSKLLAYIEDKVMAERITLNASDGAVSFYEKRGYVVTAPRKVEEGLAYTPMEKEKNDFSSKIS